MTAKELKVTLKGEDWVFNKKYLIYEDMQLDREDPYVKKCVSDAISCMKMRADEVTDEVIKCSIVNK